MSTRRVSSPDRPGAGDRGLAEVLIELSPNGILVTGPDGLLQIVNAAVHQMVPIVPDPVGRSTIDAVPLTQLAEAMSEERDDELEFTLKSGHRELLINVVPLGGDAGRMAILQDVTRLRQAESYGREFVASVSHELRTPATSIAGYVETLLDDTTGLDPSVVEMLEVVHRNAQRLILLFDDLLHLARIDARTTPLELDDCQVMGIVAEVFDKMMPPANEKGIGFQTFIPRELAVRANREALVHIIGNLVENAIKYSYEDGLVTVRATPRENQMVLIEVIDVGIGIDPNQHDMIFERFHRVDKGRARAAGGTGLGLAIVRRLCHALGASVDVRSRPGKGSVFRVLCVAGTEKTVDDDPKD